MTEDLDDNQWLERVQREVRGVEFYFPADTRNPAPGNYSVVGPTTEVASSPISIVHAAMLFLSLFKKDEQARAAASALARRHT